MKLPLSARYDLDGSGHVLDANGRTIAIITAKGATKERFIARDMVRKFNRDWRFRLFGRQPYARPK